MKIPTTPIAKMIKYLFLALVLQGCYTQQKALKDLNKANDLQPKVVADYVREHFPCTIKDTITKVDTAYQYITILCPGKDPLEINEEPSVDTVYVDKYTIKTNTIKKVVAIPSKTITITKYYEDSAKLKSLYVSISQAKEELKNCQQKKESKSEWIKWLIICLCISAILNIIQLRK
jgi:hypothetical protein